LSCQWESVCQRFVVERGLYSFLVTRTHARITRTEQSHIQTLLARSTATMVRQSPETHTEHFEMDLCATCYEAPATFCFSVWCSPCAVYMQRGRILQHRWEEATCCMGYYGSCFDECMQACPRACTAFEVCACFWCSLFGNRAAIQDRYLIQNTACEDCLFWTACICSWVRCIVYVWCRVCLGVYSTHMCVRV
jgi:hypothetical protein